MTGDYEKTFAGCMALVAAIDVLHQERWTLDEAIPLDIDKAEKWMLIREREIRIQIKKLSTILLGDAMRPVLEATGDPVIISAIGTTSKRFCSHFYAFRDAMIRYAAGLEEETADEMPIL